MYRLCEPSPLSNQVCCVQRLSDNACIPFDPANTDYANFKARINADEAQLEDADGNLMTADAAKAYVAGLP